MYYQLLGPLEVFDRERPVAVGAGKRRALLVLLLLNADRLVPAERLIDELWGERPPSTARKALQGYVVDLRKALGADSILTRAAGYELRLDGGEVDLHRFERLLGEGHAALVGGDPRGAAALLDEGLALWRGPPLADVAFEPFAAPEIARLEELRLAALEDRVQADLALGRHGEVVADLEGMVAEHPVRERLQAQLMLALYRSGRQADALDAFQAARRALVDERAAGEQPEDRQGLA